MKLNFSLTNFIYSSDPRLKPITLESVSIFGPVNALELSKMINSDVIFKCRLRYDLCLGLSGDTTNYMNCAFNMLINGPFFRFATHFPDAGHMLVLPPKKTLTKPFGYR